MTAGLAAAVMALAAVAVVVLHLGLHPVLTGSMRPEYPPGSIIVTRAVPSDHVHPGDVVLFSTPGSTTQTAHRVVSMSGPANHPILVTKGDANPLPDRTRVQLTGNQVAEVVGSVPVIGRISAALPGWMHTLLTLLAGLAICVAIAPKIAGRPVEAKRHARTHRARTALT